MSRVDVVIPCYNYGKFLSDCVGGALDDQPGTDVRVLIIDDASQDDSAEIARKLAAADDRVEVQGARRQPGPYRHVQRRPARLGRWRLLRADLRGRQAHPGGAAPGR